jgi:hypothetical protein
VSSSLEELLLCSVQMFTNGMQESHTVQVTIHDASAEALRAMVRFMYCGRLELSGDDAEGHLLLPLLVLADRYQVRALKEVCSRRLQELVNEVRAGPQGGPRRVE